MDPFVGEIRAIAFTYAPQGWALCDGSALPISQYQALFALLGTTYGGNGTSTFNLPDLRGRVAVSAGTGPGQPTYVEGQSGGSSSVTLTSNNVPPHTHPYAPSVSSAAADHTDPTGAIPATAAPTAPGRTPPVPTYSYTKGAATGTALSQQTGTAGGGQPVSIMQPYLAVYYIIALQGIFPPRP